MNIKMGDSECEKTRSDFYILLSDSFRISRRMEQMYQKFFKQISLDINSLKINFMEYNGPYETAFGLIENDYYSYSYSKTLNLE